MPNIYLLLGIAIVAFGSGWAVRGWHDDAEKLSAVNTAIDTHIAIEGKNNADSVTLETNLENLRNSNGDLDKALQVELLSKPVYRDCVVSSNGLHLSNSYIDPKASMPSKHDGKVP